MCVCVCVCVCVKILKYLLFSLFAPTKKEKKIIYLSMCILFANGSGDRVLIPGRVIPKTQKWYLIPPNITLSIIKYVSRESWSIQETELRHLPHLDDVAIAKVAFESTSTTVGQHILYIIAEMTVDCDIVVNEFELQSRYYVHFRTIILWKGTNFLNPAIIAWIVPLPSFWMNGFGIKQPTKVDMPLNKETKPEMTEIFSSEQF